MALSLDFELLSDVRLITIFGIFAREDVLDEVDVSGVVIDRVDASEIDEDELRVLGVSSEVEEVCETLDCVGSVWCNGHFLSKQDSRSCAGQSPLLASVVR